MGGSESKRRIVVEDGGGDRVEVTVTEDVVRRLKGLPDEANKDDATKNKGTQPPPQTVRSPIPSPPPSPSRGSTVPPSFRGKTDADKAREAKMKQDIEDFYNQKMKDLQLRNESLQKQTNEHFATAVKEVEQKFMNFTASPVCQDLQMKVMECYQANPGEALNCSSIVSAFTSCVDKARMASSVNRLRNVSSS